MEYVTLDDIDSSDDSKKNKLPFYKNKPLLIGIGAAVAVFLLLLFFNYARSFTRLHNAEPATEEQLVLLEKALNANYPLERYQGCKPLPYAVTPARLDVWSHAAVLIDASNGSILYEKNADAIIPPASITKLFVMYVVLDEIKKGNLKLDDIIPLPERSWAKNLPWDASRMGLGQGHIVTLKELMLGLSVNSGNDAALAIADCISGGTDQFVDRMNEECLKMGLTHTHFVEPSGYSEKNTTTAREMASFCRKYIDIFPEGLEMFHSVESFSYPQRHNLPDWPEYKNLLPYKKHNTNTLIGKLEGCDGIKTGYIDESGYNIALTCVRDGQRFISVSLGGPGHSTAEGNRTREHDGSLMMNWAFDTFADYIPENHLELSYPIAVPGGKGEKYCFLVPAWKDPISVPFATGKTPKDCAQMVSSSITIPEYVFGGVEAGKGYGYIEYKLGSNLLQKVPLVADRDIKKAGFFGTLLDKIATWLF